jgi:hypothetical protein
LTAVPAAVFGLRETLQRSKSTDAGKPTEPPMSTYDVLRSPGVPMVLYIFGHTMLLGLGYTAVSPVFLYTDVDKGGWGFSDQLIAVFLAIAGASQAVWMLVGFPPLQKRFGTGNVLRGAAVAWVLMLGGFPVMNEVLRLGATKVFWAVWPPVMILGSGVAMAYGKLSSSIPLFLVLLCASIDNEMQLASN